MTGASPTVVTAMRGTVPQARLNELVANRKLLVG